MKDFGPDYFAPAPTPEEACLRLIKGDYRRGMICDALETDPLETIPEAWLTHELSENLKNHLMGRGPNALGGEDLPDLEDGEVEIARLNYSKTIHGEVVSLRAKRNPASDGLEYSMVDEYETDYLLPKGMPSDPLAGREVVKLFMLARPCPVEPELGIEFSSFFYSDLDNFYLDI